MDTQRRKVDEILSESRGILRAGQAKKQGVDPKTLTRMEAEGYLVKESRGIYRAASLPPLTSPDFVTVTLRVPRGVFCLVSALVYHGLTTQMPYQVQVAIPRQYKAPTFSYPPIQVFKFSEASYQAGIEYHRIDEIEVPIYSKEKTIADCFKFRARMGLDLAIEALKDYFKQPGRDVDQLLHYAEINRVRRIMQPYVEMLL